MSVIYGFYAVIFFVFALIILCEILKYYFVEKTEDQDEQKFYQKIKNLKK